MCPCIAQNNEQSPVAEPAVDCLPLEVLLHRCCHCGTDSLHTGFIAYIISYHIISYSRIYSAPVTGKKHSYCDYCELSASATDVPTQLRLLRSVTSLTTTYQPLTYRTLSSHRFSANLYHSVYHIISEHDL